MQVKVDKGATIAIVLESSPVELVVFFLNDHSQLFLNKTLDNLRLKLEFPLKSV